MRRAGLAVLLLVAAAGVATADDAPAGASTGGGPTPRTWWSTEVGGGPAFAGKAIRWTGPDRATDLRGTAVDCAVIATHRPAGLDGPTTFRLGGELLAAVLHESGFSPTPTLTVRRFEATHASLLLVAGISLAGDAWTRLGVPVALYGDLAIGFAEIDVDITFPAGGPPAVHHHDTELAVRLEIGCSLGGPWWPEASGLWFRRLLLRVGVQWFATDETVITTAAGSLGGYRPDYWAVRVALGVVF